MALFVACATIMRLVLSIAPVVKRLKNCHLPTDARAEAPLAVCLRVPLLSPTVAVLCAANASRRERSLGM